MFCLCVRVKYKKTLYLNQNSLSSDHVFFLSVDDKARVLVGTAAVKQNKVYMRLDQRLRLPDHQFPVAEKHTLIASVIACR